MILQTQEVCGSGNWAMRCHSPPPPRDIFLLAIPHSQTHSNLLGKEALMDSPGIWPQWGAASGAVKDKKKLRRLYPAGTVDAHAAGLQIARLSPCPPGSSKPRWEVGKMGQLLCPERCGWSVDAHHPPATPQPPLGWFRGFRVPGRGLLRNWYRRTIWELGQRRVGGLSEAAREHR